MSKKDYIDAMNEINARESLKKETYNRVKQSGKKYNIFYPIASLAIMCTIVISIAVPMRHKMQQPEILEIQDEKTAISSLEKIENFENLYKKLKNMESNRYLYEEDFLISGVDSMTNSSTESAETVTDSVNKEYSETNTQVQGVDEADIVKTDGNYIYYLSNNEITITNVNNSEMKVASKIEFEEERFYPSEIFLRNDRLILIGTRYSQNNVKPLLESDGVWYGGSDYTVIKVYDISNRDKPEVERTVEVEGSYLSSRMIEDNIYLMANKYIYSNLCRKYEIDELNPEAFKTKYTDTAIGTEEKSIEFSDVSCIPKANSSNYLNVVSFNVTNNEPANIQSYFGAGTEIYSSASNLYVTKVNYNYEEENYKVATEIYKFSLSNAKCEFVKSGEVPGTVLNQFSMDENGEYFRIATTNSTSWNTEDDTNNLYVLDKNLEVIGKVEGLAEGEKIYSVRFMGNRAYMVTFVETDPLFVIDLSNPTNPTVLGELKIPGYSKYLHPYDETHLIGFGENTKVVNYGYGDQVVTDGMKMALFDVTDPNNPKEMYSVNIGEKGTSSELLYNHKALLFSKEKDLIAFPISITTDNYNVEFQGAIVYGLNIEEGFKLKGKISNAEDNYDLYYTNNRVRRIIYINDILYTLANSSIKATNMNTMEELSYLELE